MALVSLPTSGGSLSWQWRAAIMPPAAIQFAILAAEHLPALEESTTADETTRFCTLVSTPSDRPTSVPFSLPRPHLEATMKTIKSRSTSEFTTSLSNQSYQNVSNYDGEADFISAMHNDGGRLIKRFTYGKCQYKTGKCFNDRTVKRNGEAHSLCEEHRLKQNLIQRRSDRKYQTVHAVRRRERSQRRAVLKKQVSMAVAQQLYYEHQQQKIMSISSPQHSPLHLLLAGSNDLAQMNSVANKGVELAPPIQVPPPVFMSSGHRDPKSSLVLSVQPQHSGLETVNKKRGFALDDDELSPTGIDDFTSNMFLTINGGLDLPILRDEDFNESFGYMPLVSGVGDKEVWSDDDIELLQTILLS